MAKFIATIKAIITRLVFAAHGFVAIWQVTMFKRNSFYWYLSSPILLLFFEGIFTLTIKQNQEWKWFCPSVFLYLASIVPAIWLLELDKVDRRLKAKEETFNITSSTNLKDFNNLIGVQIRLPEIPLSTETWITLIEQFLMLILIIGRWMLPKGDLTRDQLSQLLLVYIGTAADIIEFFDSFKDDKIAAEPILVLLTLGIWSGGCCSIDVWGIAINITLQDAPFLVFRLLLITHFKIISYMNVFFTCKNTLVILLQLYRLYVVNSEHRKQRSKDDFQLTKISVISHPNMYSKKNKKHEAKKNRRQTDIEESDESVILNKKRKLNNARKDTGYSTGSSHTSNKNNYRKQKIGKQKLRRTDQETRGRRKLEEAFSEESESDISISDEKPAKKERTKKKYEKNTTVSLSTSDPSSE